MDEFEKEIKNTFLEEATELLEESEEYYMNLEDTSGDMQILDAIFRNAHSLKGSSKAVGFDQIGDLTHSLENLLLKIKEGEIEISSKVVSLLLTCNDVLTKQIQALIVDFEASFDPAPLVADIEAMISEGGAGSAPAPVQNEAPAAPKEDEGGLVLFDEDDGEDIVVEEAAQPVVEKTAPAAPQPQAAKKDSAKKPEKHGKADEKLKVSLEKIELLINSVGELVILQSVLNEHVKASTSLEMKKNVDQMGKIIKEVQDVSMGLRMIPIKPIFQKMQRIVRDTSLSLGKQVEFELIGENVEVDKTVLDHLGDPLVHLTRNAVDHGVETPEERVRTNKSPAGNVTLSAYHESGRLVIAMKDDGKGIDPEVIRKKAKEKGIPGVDGMNKEEIINLVFHAGFSTKEKVTDVSGRGVGMDVVKTNINELSGIITVTSEVGSGSLFKISLPLTLAIIDGMIVQTGERKFVLPLSFVRESVRVSDDNIRFVTGLGQVLLLRGENLPIIELNRVLGVPQSETENKEQIAIVVSTGTGEFAVVVDDILARSQVVVKQLGEEMAHLSGFSGSTILGDGQPSLIIEIPEVIAMHKPLTKNKKSDSGRAA